MNVLSQNIRLKSDADNDNTEAVSLTTGHDIGKITGWVLQAGLGLLLGFSLIQDLSKCVSLPVDDVYLLLAVMSLLLAATNLPSIPKLQFYFSRRVRIAAGAALIWYVFFALLSWRYYHRGCLINSPNDYIALTTLAKAAFPIIIGLILLQRNKSQGASLPLWSVILLAFGLIGLPLNAQLGYVPIYALGFVIAFYAGLLAKSAKVLLLFTMAACLELFAFGLSKYISGMSFFGRLGGNADGMAYPNTIGHYMVFIFAATVALLYYVSRRTRYLIYGILAFLAVCFMMLQSRGGMLAVVGMVCAYVFMHRSAIKKNRVSAFILVSVAVVLIVVILKITSGRMWSEDRPEWLRMAFNLFMQKPWFGNGIGIWQANMQWGHCHNQLGEILYNMGIFGLAVFSFFGYCIAKQIRGLVQSLSSERDKQALIIFASAIIGYLISLQVDILYHSIHVVIPILLGTMWGIAASQNMPKLAKSESHRARRIICVSAIVACLLIATASAIRTTPNVNHESIADALSYQHCRHALHPELPYGDIVGHITDSQRHPLKNVELTLDNKVTTTSADGAFQFCHILKIPVGGRNYHVKLHCRGYRDKTLDLVQVGYGPTTLDASLERQ